MSILKRLAELVRLAVGRPVREPLMGLSLWLAMLAILATLHADVFEQHEEPLQALIELPFAPLGQPEPPRILISTLLPPRERTAAMTSPLYIFALDISKSMAAQRLSEDELNRYLEAVALSHPADRAEGCHPPDRSSATGFDVARSELCRYLDSVPMGSRAALWVFGDGPELRIPQRDEQGSRYISIKETETGGTTKNQIYNAVADLQPTMQYSDFEALLRALGDRYREEISSELEVHFVIISDFILDIDHDGASGGNGPWQANEESQLSSRDRLSLALFEERLRKLSRPGKTFHLSVVLGARQMVSSVLPIVNGTMEWSAYREVHMHPNRLSEDFDFLRPYDETSAAVPFSFIPGRFEPRGVAIEVDDPRFVGGTLRLALATEASLPERFPARFTVTFEGDEPGLVRMGKGHVGRIPRLGEVIRLEPQSLLDPREASTYRLLLSWQGGSAVSASSRVCTYAAPIVFIKQLSWFGALSLRSVLVLIGVFLVWLVGACAVLLFRWCRTLLRPSSDLGEPTSEREPGEIASGT